jgi:hypothetical protein
VQSLRKALADTLKDQDLLKDAAKANLEIAPASGEQIEQNIRDLFKTDPKIVAKLKEVIK